MIPPRFTSLLIFLFCLGLLGFGLYLEHVEGLEPCPLCLIQRVFFSLVGLTALIAAVHGPARLGVRIYSTMTGALALAGGAVAARQVWLQHLPAEQVPECGPDLEYMLQAYPLGEAIAKLLQGTGDCAEVDWTFLGLSIAEWALASFAILVLVSLLQFLRPDLSPTR